MTNSLVAKALEDRLFLLGDPRTRWVQKVPRWEGEVCLVAGYVSLPTEAANFLGPFCLDYSGLLTVPFNDHPSTTRQDVLWLLEEALAEARGEA